MTLSEQPLDIDKSAFFGNYRSFRTFLSERDQEELGRPVASISWPQPISYYDAGMAANYTTRKLYWATRAEWRHFNFSGPANTSSPVDLAIMPDIDNPWVSGGMDLPSSSCFRLQEVISWLLRRRAPSLLRTTGRPDFRHEFNGMSCACILDSEMRHFRERYWLRHSGILLTNVAATAYAPER